jgi:membrane fusion protein (multidrug efflux system)
VPETLLGTLKPGLAIAARSAAYPEVPFRGTIATIDPVIDPGTRSVLVRARLPNPGGRLKPGMLLNVSIETAPRVALSVPELAVVGEGERRFVYVVDAESRVRRVPVRTGLRSGGRIEIVSGLGEGDRVVTEGVVKLADRMKVRVVGSPSGGSTRR